MNLAISDELELFTEEL
ncbi:Protein of unknown function [Bacillus mycoides]|nr:Protein of unknown function [Bacillus mycoides]